MKVAIGLSAQTETQSAAKELWEQASIKMGKEKISLAILFSSVELSQAPFLRAIKNRFPNLPLVGCSSWAIITNSGIQKPASVLILISGEELDLSVALVKNIKTKTAQSAGEELADKLLQGFRGTHRELGLFFCDGLMEEGSKFILGLQEKLGRSFPIIGASASDNLRFYKTYLYFNQEVLTDAAVGIIWGGKLNFGFGIRHGWKPLGKYRTVTAAQGNVIRTIDDKPAANIYQDYFAKGIAELKKELKYISTLYPIGIYLEGEEEYLLRNILSIEDNGFLICQGDVPVGSNIRLMIGTKESCLKATREAAEEAKQGMLTSHLGYKKEGATFDIVFIFDSASRYILLRRGAVEELKIIQAVLGEDTPLVGFYTYGEQAPLKAMSFHGQAHFHNQTISILSLGG